MAWLVGHIIHSKGVSVGCTAADSCSALSGKMNGNYEDDIFAYWLIE